MKDIRAKILIPVLGMVWAGLMCVGTASAGLRFAEQGMVTDIDGDGQDEIVRVVRDDPGGSGTFFYLLVLDTDDRGKIFSTTTLLGDRVRFLNFWRTDKGNIGIDMVQAGEGDAACCPTHKVIREWKYRDGKLEELPARPYGRVSIGDLVRLKWQLVRMEGRDVPPDAGVELSFGDGSLSGKSGCNSFTTPVTEPKPGKLRIDGPIAATSMECSAQRMDMERTFLNRLAQVTGYLWMGKYMELDWTAENEQGSLLFRLVHEE